jgi:hypothetical protein
VLCDLSTVLSAEDIVNWKIHAINLLVELASRQELLTRKLRASANQNILIKVESPSPDLFPQPSDFPLVYQKIQCIFCLGREQLPYKQRIRPFSKVSHMMDHIERVHMREPVERISCEHPVCKLDPLVLKSVMEFKSHVARVHGITLRPRERRPHALISGQGDIGIHTLSGLLKKGERALVLFAFVLPFFFTLLLFVLGCNHGSANCLLKRPEVHSICCKVCQTTLTAELHLFMNV